MTPGTSSTVLAATGAAPADAATPPAATATQVAPAATHPAPAEGERALPLLQGPPGCPLMKDPRDPCPHLLEGVLELIGRKWSLLILGTLGNFGSLRFGELEVKLGRISPKTLAVRLKELVEAGLLARQSYAEIPPRTVYSLTGEGEGLHRALLPLMDWAAGYDHATARTAPRA